MKRIILDTRSMQHTITGKGSFSLRTARPFGTRGLYFERPMIGHPNWFHLEAWVIPEYGLQVCRYSRHSGFDWHDWYVDIIHSTEEDGIWNLTDLYLDLLIKEGVGYKILDGNELADAARTGQVSGEQVYWALQSMQRLCDMLNANGAVMIGFLKECSSVL